MRNRLTSVQAKGESKEKTLEQQLEEMQSRRDLIKEKNNKIAELTEQMEKNKREFGEEEFKHMYALEKELTKKDQYIIQLK